MKPKFSLIMIALLLIQSVVHIEAKKTKKESKSGSRKFKFPNNYLKRLRIRKHRWYLLKLEKATCQSRVLKKWQEILLTLCQAEDFRSESSALTRELWLH